MVWREARESTRVELVEGRLGKWLGGGHLRPDSNIGRRAAFNPVTSGPEMVVVLYIHSIPCACTHKQSCLHQSSVIAISLLSRRCSCFDPAAIAGVIEDGKLASSLMEAV